MCLLMAGCASPGPQATPAPSEPWLTATATTVDTPAFAERREAMVRDTIVARGVADPDVLRAMRTVLRHVFVPGNYMGQAYEDHPLPIGYGQTISQPYVVALMTESLELKPGDRVLEIGTGSGYQAAVLAELQGVEVYSIEIVPQLAEQAAARLQALRYDNIHLKQGDGYYGWLEHGPYNAIIVTAAPDHLPPPLVAQLADAGRLVIPIGPPGGYQTLWQFVKQGEDVKASSLADVSFVPLTGGPAAP